MIAGVGAILASTQRSLGYDSHTFDYVDKPGYPGYPTDLNANVQLMPTKLQKGMKLLWYVLRNRLWSDYDVYHLHYGRSLLPFNVDLPLLKIRGRQIVAHYHGSDIRGRGEGILTERLAEIKFVSTPDLLTDVPDATWIPNPVAVPSYDKYRECSGTIRRSTVNILHAPTNRETKGTEYIVRAVEELQQEGHSIKFSLVEKTSHGTLMEMVSRADIVVDQINMEAGWYGVFGCEAMALKKPVCAYIREDLEDEYLPCKPIVNVNPRNITEQLRSLIQNRDLRLELGERGYRYVAEVHDAVKTTEMVTQYYRL